MIKQSEKKSRKDHSERSLPMLPPCRVCGEKASGLHYGVNTCEACKAFFRRSLQRGKKYVCAVSDNCSILPGKRSSCSACRFNKCQNLGMCKEAIKTGRYTHEKRSENIREVKRLSEPLQNNHKLNIYSSISRPICDMPLLNEEFENIIKNITSNYMKDTVFNDKFYEQLPEKQKDYLEKKALQTEVFGPLGPIPKDEYERIYQSTGIDVDGRKEDIIAEMPHMEKAIKKFISFTKTIPGFNRLCIEDQMALIKTTKFEAWMIFCHKLFNLEKGLYMFQSGRIVGIDDMKRVNDGEFIDSMFYLADKFQKLQMCIEEICMLTAMCVMSTDMCRLQVPEKVEDSQNYLLSCLLYLMQRNTPDQPLRFAHMCSCLLQLRTVKELHAIEEESFLMEWSSRVEMPRLMYEIWSS